ncbi:MAG: hypothetical protein ABW185_02485 [Sedimenticola sp.]
MGHIRPHADESKPGNLGHYSARFGVDSDKVAGHHPALRERVTG